MNSAALIHTKIANFHVCEQLELCKCFNLKLKYLICYIPYSDELIICKATCLNQALLTKIGFCVILVFKKCVFSFHLIYCSCFCATLIQSSAKNLICDKCQMARRTWIWHVASNFLNFPFTHGCCVPHHVAFMWLSALYTSKTLDCFCVTLMNINLTLSHSQQMPRIIFGTNQTWQQYVYFIIAVWRTFQYDLPFLLTVSPEMSRIVIVDTCYSAGTG